MQGSIQQWIEWASGLLGKPGAGRAILVGLVISWGVTQFIKNAPSITGLSETWRITATRAAAFALGAVPAWVLWPEPGAAAVVMAIGVGAAAPTVYKLGARALYHFFPWLEPKMSGAPAKPDECA